MKVSEARDMSIDEARQKMIDLKQELFNLRFQHAVGQLENPQKMKHTKRSIARLFTIIRETELQPKSES